MKKLASLVLAIVLTLSVCIVGAAMAEGNTIYVLGPTPDHSWTAQAGAYAQAKCEEITAEGTYKAKSRLTRSTPSSPITMQRSSS